MSPEQVTGERVDGRSDIFALGCVLYEMLSGRALFGGSTPQEIVAQLMHDRVPELSDFDAVAPRELRPIVSRCIERVAVAALRIGRATWRWRCARSSAGPPRSAPAAGRERAASLSPSCRS